MFNFLKSLTKKKKTHQEQIMKTDTHLIPQEFLTIPERYVSAVSVINEKVKDTPHILHLTKDNNELLRAITLNFSEVNNRLKGIEDKQEITNQGINGISKKINKSTEITAKPEITIKETQSKLKGLSERDKEIYFFILNKGITKAGNIQDKFNYISRTTLYRIIKGLNKKGLITEVSKGTYKKK